MTKQTIMKKAHALAKRFEGHYAARIALALKIIWRRIKSKDSLVYVKDWIVKKNKMLQQAVMTTTIAGTTYADELWSVIRQTDKAYRVKQFEANNSQEFWIPKSQCHAY